MARTRNGRGDVHREQQARAAALEASRLELRSAGAAYGRIADDGGAGFDQDALNAARERLEKAAINFAFWADQ